MKQLERNSRKYLKIQRYVEKKNAIENLTVDFKSLLGINHEDREAVERRANRQTARIALGYLIGIFLLEENPYEAKQQIRDDKIIEEWLQRYDINIFSVSKEDVDILEEIIRKI